MKSLQEKGLGDLVLALAELKDDYKQAVESGKHSGTAYKQELLGDYIERRAELANEINRREQLYQQSK